MTDEGPVRLKYFMAFYRPFSPYLRWVTQVECVLEVGIVTHAYDPKEAETEGQGSGPASVT